MYMFDPAIGEMDVELEIPKDNIQLTRISAGYVVTNFRELTEEELDYLNEKYYEDIVTQAMAINVLEGDGAVKLYH